MGFSRNSRSLVDIGRIFISVESGRFLRYRVDIGRNLRLVDLSRFPRFYFGFRFRVVYYKVFLLIIGGGK